MKSSQSNFDFLLPNSYLAHSYLIATVPNPSTALIKKIKKFTLCKRYMAKTGHCEVAEVVGTAVSSNIGQDILRSFA